MTTYQQEYQKEKSFEKDLQEKLKDNKIYLLNIISGPGAGKTTTILSLVKELKNKYKIGVLEADYDNAIDTKKMQEENIKTVPLKIAGLQQVTIKEVNEGMNSFYNQNYDLVILENMGNLLFLAEHKLAANKTVLILSVPEGDDMPLKYPLVFQMCDVLIITKIDAMNYFDFDFEACVERVKQINPNVQIFAISNKTNSGIKEICHWLDQDIQKNKGEDYVI